MWGQNPGIWAEEGSFPVLAGCTSWVFLCSKTATSLCLCEQEGFYMKLNFYLAAQRIGRRKKAFCPRPSQTFLSWVWGRSAGHLPVGPLGQAGREVLGALLGAGRADPQLWFRLTSQYGLGHNPFPRDIMQHLLVAEQKRGKDSMWFGVLMCLWSWIQLKSFKCCYAQGKGEVATT